MSDQYNPYAVGSAVPTYEPQSYGSVELADRSTRLLGAIIDGLILVPLVIPFALLIGYVVGSTLGDTWFADQLAGVLGGLLGLGLFVAVHGYLLAKSGQTVGKKLLNMKIVGDDGRQLPLGELIVKRYGIIWVLSMIPFVGFVVSLANPLAIFRENHKCLHDELAKTKVIKV